MATAKIKLTTSITRTYGAVTTSWGMECEVTVSSRSDILKEYARMHDHIRAEMIDFESATLPRLPAPAAGGLPEAQPTPDEKIGWHPLKEIVREEKKGQTFYYARTSSGFWMRYGAPLYMDSIQGINQDTFDANQNKGVMSFEADQWRVRVIKRGEKYYAQAIAHKDKVRA